MPKPDKCGTCNGCGKIDSEEGKPWADITALPNARVQAGEIVPIICKDCFGTGNKPGKKSEQLADGDKTPVAAPDMRAIPATRPVSEQGVPVVQVIGAPPPAQSAPVQAPGKGDSK